MRANAPKMFWTNILPATGPNLSCRMRPHVVSKRWSLTLSGPGGGGGAQRPGWPTQSCQSETSYTMMRQTLWILVFIPKKHSDQILAKLINRGEGVAAALSHRDDTRKFWWWKNFALLENCWNWHGGEQLWLEKNDSGHKSDIFEVKPVFRGK